MIEGAHEDDRTCPAARRKHFQHLRLQVCAVAPCTARQLNCRQSDAEHARERVLGRWKRPVVHSRQGRGRPWFGSRICVRGQSRIWLASCDTSHGQLSRPAQHVDARGRHIPASMVTARIAEADPASSSYARGAPWTLPSPDAALKGWQACWWRCGDSAPAACGTDESNMAGPSRKPSRAGRLASRTGQLPRVASHSDASFRG